jgi:predicted nucleotidyltransferase
MHDEAFMVAVADRLAALPGVQAVALGGSRATGTHRPDSDWDLAVYYRAGFDPQDLRAVGWAGEVFEIGAWGGGVFNGGAWLRIDGRPVDVHYRDLNSVEHEIAEARAGRVRFEPLMFHLAGIPSYQVVAELAVGRTLRGRLPRPEFPPALRAAARAAWWQRADLTLAYAHSTHAARGRLAQCAGLLAVATTQAAHAVLAARGEWITNEKALLDRAGLRDADRIVGSLAPDPDVLRRAVDATRELCRSAVGDIG